MTDKKKADQQASPKKTRCHHTKTISLAQSMRRRYSAQVSAKSGADLGRSINSRRTGAPKTIAGAFFVPAVMLYGSCARDTFGCAGFLESRSANPRTAVTIPRLAANGDSSTIPGATPMQQLRNLRAAAHRRMAIAALRADSSLSTRLARYQHHMTKARALEAVGGAQ